MADENKVNGTPETDGDKDNKQPEKKGGIMPTVKKAGKIGWKILTAGLTLAGGYAFFKTVMPDGNSKSEKLKTDN